MLSADIKQSLLKNELLLFTSDYGKKGVAESWTVRLKKQIKQLDQFKEFANVNIATGGDSLIVDVDLDCPEALELADVQTIYNSTNDNPGKCANLFTGGLGSGLVFWNRMGD